MSFRACFVLRSRFLYEVNQHLGLCVPAPPARPHTPARPLGDFTLVYYSVTRAVSKRSTSYPPPALTGGGKADMKERPRY